MNNEQIRLYLGDCLDMMKLIPDNSVDMVFSDIPYGSTKNEWDIPIDLLKMWLQLGRICKSGAAIVLTAQTPYDKVLGCSNIDMLRYEWIWEKTSATGHLNAKKMPMKAHENVLVFYDKLPTYNPIKTTGHPRKVSTASHKRNSKKSTNYNDYDLSSYDSTERYPRSVLKMASDKQKSKLHPTQKPVSLSTYMIETYSNPGDLVLDFCMGSGTTGISCIDTDRKFIGIEKFENIFEIAKERLKQHFKTK